MNRDVILKKYLGENQDITICGNGANEWDETVSENKNIENNKEQNYVWSVCDEGKIKSYFLDAEMTNGILHGKIIAVLFKEDSEEFAFVLARENQKYHEPEIEQKISLHQENRWKECFCLYEKSCGCVVYYEDNGKREYLLVKNRDGHFGFPKGHIEADESEMQTALRELFEETGTIGEILEKPRFCCSYIVKNIVKKEAVYFLVKGKNRRIIVAEGEIGGFVIADYKIAKRMLIYDNEKSILTQAERFLALK